VGHRPRLGVHRPRRGRVPVLGLALVKQTGYTRSRRVPRGRGPEIFWKCFQRVHAD
jgi:hypothetical protein